MPKELTFAGREFHQDSVQVGVINPRRLMLANRSVPDNPGLIHESLTRSGQPERIDIEACCGAADLAVNLLTGWNLPIQLAHAGYVHRMKQSPDKTGFSDAQLLADCREWIICPKSGWLPKRSASFGVWFVTACNGSIAFVPESNCLVSVASRHARPEAAVVKPLLG